MKTLAALAENIQHEINEKMGEDLARWADRIQHEINEKMGEDLARWADRKYNKIRSAIAASLLPTGATVLVMDSEGKRFLFSNGKTVEPGTGKGYHSPGAQGVDGIPVSTVGLGARDVRPEFVAVPGDFRLVSNTVEYLIEEAENRKKEKKDFYIHVKAQGSVLLELVYIIKDPSMIFFPTEGKIATSGGLLWKQRLYKPSEAMVPAMSDVKSMMGDFVKTKPAAPIPTRRQSISPTANLVRYGSEASAGQYIVTYDAADNPYTSKIMTDGREIYFTVHSDTFPEIEGDLKRAYGPLETRKSDEIVYCSAPVEQIRRRMS